MQSNKFFIAAILLVSVPVWALTTGQKLLLDPNNLSRDQSVQLAPKLYDVNRDALIQVAKGDYLPNRVYAVYEPKRKSWLYAITNSRGHFKIPSEWITAGTVLKGSALGAQNPYQRYQLDKNWKWVPTNASEQYVLWVMSTPPRLKRITFLEPYRAQN